MAMATPTEDMMRTRIAHKIDKIAHNPLVLPHPSTELVPPLLLLEMEVSWPTLSWWTRAPAAALVAGTRREPLLPAEGRRRRTSGLDVSRHRRLRLRRSTK
jgi:hypothetical protein